MPGPTRLMRMEAFPGEWTFASAPPDADLSSIVVEYWEVKGELAPFRERVLPNGCIEVMVNLGPPHETIADGVRTLWRHAWFSGLHERAIEIESKSGTYLVSARLTPLGAWLVFGAAAARTANQVVDLETFAGPSAAVLRDELESSAATEARFAILDQFIRPLAQCGTPASEFVTATVRRIDEAHGAVLVSSLYKEASVSRRHLSFRFAQEIGMPPKAYARIRRFVWTLAQLQASDSVDWAQLAAAAGYSDQSHLGREFQRIAAASPMTYLRKRSPDNTATLEVPDELEEPR